MEKFYNANKIPFSKIYLKLTGVNEIKMARGYLKPRLAKARVVLSSSTTNQTTNEIEYISAPSDNLLFKLRTVYFTNALPVYRHFIQKILERVWTSKLDKKSFESQNGLRVEVSILDVSHFLTNKNENTFGYKYTISINGQDPEFMGVTEPTYSDFVQEPMENSIEFCACKAYEVERVYIR